MAEYWEKMLFDDTRKMLDSGSADFLTGDELKFIEHRTNDMYTDFLRGIPGLDMETAGTLSDFTRRFKSGGVPETRQEIEDFQEALDRLCLSPGLSNEYRQPARNLSLRLQNYTRTLDKNSFGLQSGRLDSPIIDRYGVFGNREPDPIEENIRKSTFDSFVRIGIDSLIGNVREEAKTRPFARFVPEETKQAILDDLIATFDANGLDSSWLRELKEANFRVSFHDVNAGKSKAGRQTFVQDGDLVVSMNAEKYPDYSDAMKVRLLHELRHVWQRRQDKWKHLFGDGITTKTDMDVEVDAHEMQFALERILGMKGDKIRAFFEGIDNAKGRYSSKLFQKANRLFTNPYGKHPDKYKIKTNMEYNAEFNE